MPIITKQTLVDSERNLVVAVTVQGDSYDASDTGLFDISTYAGFDTSGGWGNVKVTRCHGAMNGMTASLSWNADTNVPFLAIPSDQFDMDFCRIGGLVNNTDSTANGDILLTTSGSTAADIGYFVLEMKKRSD